MPTKHDHHRPPLCPIEPPAGPLPRYTQQPLPAYRFVPGLYPHPTADPDGHSYRSGMRTAAHSPPPTWDCWQQSSDYLYGADLYNHAYWWEAHDIWEVLWQQTEPRSLQHHFFQGLIQIAAAHLKRHLQRPVGVHRLVARGLTNLWLVQRLQRPDTVCMGLELSIFIDHAEGYFNGTSPTYPLIRLVLTADNE